MTRARAGLGALAALALLAQGCAAASATAGAAVAVTGAVVATGVGLTGKAIGAGIDAVSGPCRIARPQRHRGARAHSPGGCRFAPALRAHRG